VITIGCISLSVGGCAANDPIAPPFALQHTYAVRDPEFRRVMDQVCGPSFLPGNSIDTFKDAPEIVSAMIDAIGSAKHTITCETFILESDSVGRPFMKALSERARAGVKVHLVIDGFGSASIDGSDISRMEDAGVRVVKFNPLEKVLLVFTVGDVNYRTHRKMLVIDGRVGFTGGIGFSERWHGDGETSGVWRENGYRIEGPVVAQMQAAFMRNWLKSVGEVLDGEEYLPSLARKGDAGCQFVMCSPKEGVPGIELTYFLAMNAAEKSIDIATAYFVPDDSFNDCLTASTQRGVRVRVLMPGPHTDSKLAIDASKARWQALLDADVQLFEYQPAMYHFKVMIVDQLWTAVGSANLDPRSLRLSEEANLNVLDEVFARDQTAIFEGDLAQAVRITEWKHQSRSALQVISEFLASFFSPQL
jgi:cardiolipin synthase